MTLEPVKEELSDKVLEIGKTIVETFVPAGASAVKILDALFGIPIQRRQETLIQDICESINKILNKGFVLEQLQHDENFIEVLLQATKIASITFKEEKRAALKKAIYNSVAQTNPPIFELQQIFLCYIETFNVAHLKLLYFLVDPRDWFVKHGKDIPDTRPIAGASIRDVIIKAYPELGNEIDLVDSLWSDLYSKNLLHAAKHMLDKRPPLPSKKSMLDMIVPPIDVLSCQVTSLGKQFVGFISN